MNKYIECIFKLIEDIKLKLCRMWNDDGYMRYTVEDDELDNLLEEKIDHPFDEDERVIIH